MTLEIPQEFIVFLETKEPVPFETYARVMSLLYELASKHYKSPGRPRKYSSDEDARRANIRRTNERKRLKELGIISTHPPPELPQILTS